MKYAILAKELRSLSSPKVAEIFKRFFKTGKGEYGEGDHFIGVKVPVIRSIACKYPELELIEIEKLLQSKIHEERLLGTLLLVDQFKKADLKQRSRIFKFYLKNRKTINNWDLVDGSAPTILGGYCFEVGSHKVMDKLLRSKRHWDRRMAILATFYYTRQGKVDLTFRYAAKLLNDREDLMHKATGWMLREAGKRDEKKLLNFIKVHGKKMPRTMLRYSIEKFSPKVRKKLLILSKILLLISFLNVSSLWAKAGEFHGGVSFVHQEMNYKEPSVMSEKGKLQGVGLDARYEFTDQLKLSLQGKFLSGELEYDGATFDGVPLKQTTKDSLREYRGLIGYDVGDFTPYVGYGQRYWRNDLVISYVRETTYNYVPLGLTYGVAPFYISYERRIFLGGLNKSHMSDISPFRRDVEVDQESGKGYALEAGFYSGVGILDFKISIGYEYWQIEDSETANDGVDTLIEPHNRTSSIIISGGVFF